MNKCIIFLFNNFLFIHFLPHFLPGIAGYVSSKFYRQIGGTNWAWNIVLTASLFAGQWVYLYISMNVNYTLDYTYTKSSGNSHTRRGSEVVFHADLSCT